MHKHCRCPPATCALPATEHARRKRVPQACFPHMTPLARAGPRGQADAADSLTLQGKGSPRYPQQCPCPHYHGTTVNSKKLEHINPYTPKRILKGISPLIILKPCSNFLEFTVCQPCMVGLPSAVVSGGLTGRDAWPAQWDRATLNPKP